MDALSGAGPRRARDRLGAPSSGARAPAAPWARFSAWLECVCVVTFDLEVGQALEVSGGPLRGQGGGMTGGGAGQARGVQSGRHPRWLVPPPKPRVCPLLKEGKARISPWGAGERGPALFIAKVILWTFPA